MPQPEKINLTLRLDAVEKVLRAPQGSDTEIAEGILPEQNILTLGKYLMTQFMLPFEVVSVLLLAAMIGAIVLARKENA